MLKDLKKTTKHTSIYALGNIATKVIGIILIPLYTNTDYLSHNDFGALAVLEATSQLIIGVLTMSMVQNLSRWYWDKKYSAEQKSIFFSTIAFLIFCIIPISLILIYFSNELSFLILNSRSYGNLIKLTIGVSSIQIINNQILCLAKLQSKSVRYSTTQISKLVITLSLTLIGILYKGLGLEAIWISALIGEIFTLVIQVPYVLKNIKPKVNVRIIREMLNYGFPLMLAAVSGVLLATMDRYMLSTMSGLEKTGVYSLGFRIANTLKVVVTTSLGLAISPIKMQYIGKENNRRFYSKINTYSTFIFIVALLGLSLFSLEAIKLFTDSKIYWEANNIVPIISYALLFGLIKDNTLIGLTIQKKTKSIGILIVITSCINLVLNYILIPTWSIYGASVATLLSQIFFCITITILSQKAYYIPYEWKKIVLMTVVSVLLIVISSFVSDLNIYSRLTIKIILLISFPFILVLFNFYEKVEIDTLRKSLRLWKRPKEALKNLL